MAGWPILPNGSSLDSGENVVTDENKVVVIVSSDDDDDDDDDNNKNDESDCSSDVRLRDLFDEVLSHFIKAIGEKGLFRPLPVILDGEEKPVDLFTLFSVVRAKGGYGSVSNRQLWGFVARELGLRVRESASAKLLYFKYLNELEKWVVDRESFGGLDGVFRLLSSEIETEFRGLLPEIELARIEDLDDNDIDNNNNKSELVVGSEMNLGDDEKGKEFKRKRECLLDMLRWLAEVAKLSSGRSFGECSDGKEFFAQAIRAREVLLRSRHVSINNHEESLGQKKPKMHPSMYDDSGARSHHSSERLRCSKRLTHVAKSRLCPCCNSGPPNHPSKSAEPIEEPPPPPPPPLPEPIEAELPPPATEPAPPLENLPAEKHVSVGPEFQAEVPEWAGPVRDSDPKWLGTRVWPRPEPSKTSSSSSVVGKGRLGFCRCPFPGSGECVRFHVAEARMKLKLELGPAFFAWGFHRMGEEVSLRWAPEEEGRFKEVVKSNSKAFGDRRVWWVLKKTRESLVSYYFNVFLVRKRSYQNRVTPKEVDSDDDEAEFGSIGGLYGDGSVGPLGPTVEACAQNMQCAELEEARI